MKTPKAPRMKTEKMWAVVLRATGERVGYIKFSRPGARSLARQYPKGAVRIARVEVREI